MQLTGQIRLSGKMAVSKLLKKKLKEKAKKKATQKLFADKFTSQLDEGQSPSRGTLDVEAGKAGKVTQGSRSMPRMQEALSRGSRERAKVVAALEAKKEKGTITSGEEKMLNRLNALSRQADEARTSAAAKTRREQTSKAKGVTLATPEGRKTVGAKPKVKDSDMMVGNTSNGITKDGEVIGNPTDNQVATVVRNMNARETLSAAAKRNLAKLKRMSQKDKQDMALRQMERRMVDTGPDRRAKGGVITGRPRTGHMDYRKKGLFQ